MTSSLRKLLQCEAFYYDRVRVASAGGKEYSAYYLMSLALMLRLLTYRVHAMPHLLPILSQVLKLSIFYLFIYHSFKNSVCSWDHTLSDLGVVHELMNLKGCGRKQLWHISKYYHVIPPKGLCKTTKNSRIIAILVDIRIGPLPPNTGQNCYHMASLLVWA